MKIKGKIECKSAVIVNDTFLKNIDSIISKYFIKPTYSAIILSGDSIEFDSLEELLNYENGLTEKIVSLNIDYGYYNSIRISSMEDSYDSSILIFYITDDSDTKVLFDTEIKNEINKISTSKLYSFISSSSISRISFIIFLIFTMISIVSYFYGGQSSIKQLTILFNPLLYLAFVFAVFVYLGILFGIRDIIRKLFPSVVFYLGMEKERYNKIKDIRKNIFWCVIVAFILAVIVDVISSFF